ncbi:glycerate kinase [Parasphingorhabdus pacifica]
MTPVLPGNPARVGASVARVLVASDKFKGSLSAEEVGEAVRLGLCTVHPRFDVAIVPVADGGDGTLAAAAAAGYELVPVSASGPTGQPVLTAYARLGSRAVVELAHVSGLARLPGRTLAPWTATSRGTGEVIAAALDAGCRYIFLGLGGSASTDGGAGMLAALGARLFDAADAPVPDPGAHLDAVARVDLTAMHPALDEAEIVLACDVDNPLTGPYGAAAIYGPQKGVTPDDLLRFDANLTAWGDAMAAATGVDHRDAAGAGAAGGVGFAALAALGAEIRPGIDLVLELVKFDEHLSRADLVVTGEGSLDEQTMAGKAPAGVAAAAAATGIPVVAVCGRRKLTDEQLHTMGISAGYALLDIENDASRCMTNAVPLLHQLAERIAHDHLPSGDT